MPACTLEICWLVHWKYVGLWSTNTHHDCHRREEEITLHTILSTDNIITVLDSSADFRDAFAIKHETWEKLAGRSSGKITAAETKDIEGAVKAMP